MIVHQLPENAGWAVSVITDDRKSADFLARALNKLIDRIVGEHRYFAADRYPTVYQGTKWRAPGAKQKRIPVATVAAIQEWGGEGKPERPFFRQSVAASKDKAHNAIRKGLRGRQAEEPFTTADVLQNAGGIVADQVRGTIDSYRDRDGKPALVDTGKLRDSVEVRVSQQAEGKE